MRSFKYCNFEVTLGTDKPCTPEEVDTLRNEAARLVDKAVDDYRSANHSDETPSRTEKPASGDGYIIDRSYSQEVE